jgi:putative phosphoribosyl transferase
MSARQFGADSSAIAIQPVHIRVTGGILEGDLVVPAGARGLVVFAHGSGSSRSSPRNQHVAQVLQAAHSATLLFDLLTPDEEEEDAESGHLRFNIPWLAERLVSVTRWAALCAATKSLRLGYFGSSTGAAAALVAAASLGRTIDAVVSRGGRPDLASDALPRVHAPTLLIVGGADALVLQLNRQAYARLHCPKELAVVPGASHLFEEEGALEQVAHLAARWFQDHWKPVPGRA